MAPHVKTPVAPPVTCPAVPPVKPQAWTERRFAAFAVADPEQLAALAERVLEEARTTELVAGPRTGTMLVELTESVRGEPFHLGEVVVTEATVLVDGCRGDGLVLGLDAERATAAAVCDAAAEAGLLAAEMERLVRDTETAHAAGRAQTAAAIAGTRVSVEVIAG
jgi:alpha-D-ribose 1-methylphosphonate 5-triphosphate synthase subunit PhnG